VAHATSTESFLIRPINFSINPDSRVPKQSGISTSPKWSGSVYDYYSDLNRKAGYCDVCLVVCLSANISWKPHRIFVHVVWGRDSVLLWRRCNMLCTSVFWMTPMFDILDRMAACSATLASLQRHARANVSPVLDDVRRQD